MPVLGPPFAYTDLLDHETNLRLGEQRDSGSNPFFPLRPSSAGKCTRTLTYELLEFLGKAKYEKKLNDPASKRLLDLGHSIESHIIQQFDRAVPKNLLSLKYRQQTLEFYKLEAATDNKLSYWIEGSLDAVFISSDSKGVVDFKSKKDRFSAMHRTGWDDTDEKLGRMKTVEKFSETGYFVEDLPAFLDDLDDAFFAANFLQLNSYACTEFLRNRGIDHGAIIQYCKNDSRLREVRFKPSQILYDKVRAKFQAALDAAALGDPNKAPRDFELGSISCAYCPFAKECWGDVNALKEFYATFNKRWPKDLDDSHPVAQAFLQYEKCVQVGEMKDKLEAQIIKGLEGIEEKKVRLSNGNVYELKFLKTPRPHVELRRSKA